MFVKYTAGILLFISALIVNSINTNREQNFKIILAQALILTSLGMITFGNENQQSCVFAIPPITNQSKFDENISFCDQGIIVNGKDYKYVYGPSGVIIGVSNNGINCKFKRINNQLISQNLEVKLVISYDRRTIILNTIITNTSQNSQNIRLFSDIILNSAPNKIGFMANSNFNSTVYDPTFQTVTNDWFGFRIKHMLCYIQGMNAFSNINSSGKSIINLKSNEFILEAGQSKTVNTKITLMPLNISNLELYDFQNGDKLVGFWLTGGFERNVHRLLEFLSKYFGPILALFILILCVRLLVFRQTFRAEIIYRTMPSLKQSDTLPQQLALMIISKRVQVGQMLLIWLLQGIIFLFVVQICSVSGIFYDANLLWVKNLYSADSTNLICMIFNFIYEIYSKADYLLDQYAFLFVISILGFLSMLFIEKRKFFKKSKIFILICCIGIFTLSCIVLIHLSSIFGLKILYTANLIMGAIPIYAFPFFLTCANMVFSNANVDHSILMILLISLLMSPISVITGICFLFYRIISYIEGLVIDRMVYVS